MFGQHLRMRDEIVHNALLFITLFCEQAGNVFLGKIVEHASFYMIADRGTRRRDLGSGLLDRLDPPVPGGAHRRHTQQAADRQKEQTLLDCRLHFGQLHRLCCAPCRFVLAALSFCLPFLGTTLTSRSTARSLHAPAWVAMALGPELAPA